MKSENIEVRKACEKRDWENAGKWLHINKASFKAFRRIHNIMKTDIPRIKKRLGHGRVLVCFPTGEEPRNENR